MENEGGGGEGWEFEESGKGEVGGEWQGGRWGLLTKSGLQLALRHRKPSLSLTAPLSSTADHVAGRGKEKEEREKGKKRLVEVISRNQRPPNT
jgi:hypothetical protein